MSQHDMIIDNAGGGTVRADLNNALQALASTSKGNSAPATPYAGQLWIDDNTPSSSLWTLSVYDGTDWITVGLIDTTGNGFTPYVQTPIGGFVNRFRNGALDIWQRGTSGTITAGSPAYTADGWIVSSTGANVPWAQTAGRASTAFALKATGASSVTDILFKQRIESSMAALLYPNASAQVTVQAKIYNNTGGSITPTLTVKHATATDNWGATSTDVSAVSLQACPNTTLTTVSYTFASASGTANGLEVTIDCGNNFSTSGKSVEISELDIRVTPGAATGLNSNPPAPELRPIASEMSLNQRYFYSNYAPGVAPGTSSSTTYYNFIAIRTDFFGSIYLPVTMRIAPTMTIYSPTTGTSAKVRNGDTSADITVSSTASYPNAFTITATLIANDNYLYNFTASAEL